MASDLPDYDEQDQAEAFDEDVIGDEGVGPSPDMRVFEELPDVYDVTRALGDADVDPGPGHLPARPPALGADPARRAPL